MGDDLTAWRRHDAVALIEDGARVRPLEHAKLWQDAKLTREYVEALKASRSERDADAGGPERQKWIEWAEASIAQRILAETDPEIVLQSVAAVTSYWYRDL